MNVTPELAQFASPAQDRYLEAVLRLGSCRKAAKELGVHNATVARCMKSLIDKAARQGWSPEHDMTRTVPDGFRIQGTSTLYDMETGQGRLQWVKTTVDHDRQLELLRAAVDAMSGEVQPLPPVPAPVIYDHRLLTVIPLGDPHFGMKAWAAEVGEGFDLETAEQLTFAAVDRLCARTPSSNTALLLNLGDYFHADNGTNRTPRSGANLDVDGRFRQIAETGVRALIRCIERLLQKHQTVIVRNNPGNHDPHQAAMLSICLAARFHDNPRVRIDESPSSFFYYRFGKTLIGSTHGDGAKLNDLPLIMARDVKEDWAAADFRVWHCGHFHHDQVKDLVGCTVETHRTLVPNDAWHFHQGYRSMRDIKAIVYDVEYGEICRMRCGVEQL